MILNIQIYMLMLKNTHQNIWHHYQVRKNIHLYFGCFFYVLFNCQYDLSPSFSCFTWTLYVWSAGEVPVVVEPHLAGELRDDVVLGLQLVLLVPMDFNDCNRHNSKRNYEKFQGVKKSRFGERTKNVFLRFSKS